MSDDDIRMLRSFKAEGAVVSVHDADKGEVQEPIVLLHLATLAMEDAHRAEALPERQTVGIRLEAVRGLAEHLVRYADALERHQSGEN